jgi:hypothetical protein
MLSLQPLSHGSLQRGGGYDWGKRLPAWSGIRDESRGRRPQPQHGMQSAARYYCKISLKTHGRLGVFRRSGSLRGETVGTHTPYFKWTL